VFLDTAQLQSLAGPENKSLADHVAILISSVGENLVLRRAACVTVNEDHDVAGFTHPSPGLEHTGPILGKFGSLMVYQDLKTGDKQQNVQNVARQLCQHVIGKTTSCGFEVIFYFNLFTSQVTSIFILIASQWQYVVYTCSIRISEVNIMCDLYLDG
jgi:Translation elongation factor Ts